VAALHPPGQPGYLAGAPQPAAPKPEALPPPVAAAPATIPVPPAVSLPNESEMTDADRHKVQDALTRLGYYSLPVDGIFGPETHAAIRRYQHEIGGDMTGQLTAAQASRLVNTR
jgi:peptidoglycan hydrolase-like protein with peptidoglycan-binding domain